MKTLFEAVLCALLCAPAVAMAGSVYEGSDWLFERVVDRCVQPHSTWGSRGGYPRNRYYGSSRYEGYYYGLLPRGEGWSIYSPTRYDTYTYVRRGLQYSFRKYGPFTGLSISQ